MSITAIALTTIGVIGVGGHVYYETKVKKDELKKVKEKIARYEGIRENYRDLKYKIADGKDKLVKARRCFKSGGHVYDEEPLAAKEFSSCIDKLNTANDKMDKIIEYYDDKISNLKRQKRALE